MCEFYSEMAIVLLAFFQVLEVGVWEGGGDTHFEK